MIAERGLRLVAIAIAVAALADPVLTREGGVAHAIRIVMIEPAMADAAQASAERLRAALATDYLVSVRLHAPKARASACSGDGGCIVISHGTMPFRMTNGAEVVGAVRIPHPPDRPVLISRLITPRLVNLNAAARLNVGLRASADSRPVGLQIFDAGVLVGHADVELPSDAQPTRDFVVPVGWVPLAPGTRRLRVVAKAEQGAEAVAEAGVEVSDEPLPALFYEPEATWLGTFVRRALAADGRFDLDARTRLAPGLAMTREGGSGLVAASLADARAIVVSSPQSLTANEVDLLERFARRRGGSVVLLPDRRPSGPVLRLMPAIAAERRETEPRVAGVLRASEMLTFEASSNAISVLETADNRPIVVARALGRGRVIVSGALDAWRFRGDGSQFSRFFSGLVAAAVDATGPALHIALDDPLIGRGESTTLAVEWRTMDAIPRVMTAGAELRCGGAAPTPIRLWPGARPGVFSGTVHAMAAAHCTVAASISRPSQVANEVSLIVAEHADRPVGNLDALDAGIAAHGGVVVAAGDETALVARAQQRLPARREPSDTHPMRSPWWMVPFAACLGGEWWLRRRSGRR